MPGRLAGRNTLATIGGGIGRLVLDGYDGSLFVNIKAVVVAAPLAAREHCLWDLLHCEVREVWLAPEGAAADEERALRADLFTDVKREMAAGTDPSDPKAAELAKRWLALVTAFTGGDPGIFNSLKNMYQKEDNVMGMNVPEKRLLMEYIQKAAAAAGIKHPGQ